MKLHFLFFMFCLSIAGCSSEKEESIFDYVNNENANSLTVNDFHRLGVKCVSSSNIALAKDILLNQISLSGSAEVVNKICATISIYEMIDPAQLTAELLINAGIVDIFTDEESIDRFALETLKNSIVGPGTTVDYLKQILSEYKYNREVKWPKQVSISFDDGISMESIAKNIHIFDKYDANFTFYLSHFFQYDKSTMLFLQRNGVEIGHHTTLHFNAIDYVEKYGIEKWEKDEILLQLDAMKSIGLNVTSFAYPYGVGSNKTDTLLKKHFNVIRKFDSRPNIVYRIVSGYHDVVTSYSIDSHRINLDLIFKQIDRLKGGDTLYISSHVIGDWVNEFYISLSDLEKILDYGSQKGISFCSVSDCEKVFK